MKWFSIEGIKKEIKKIRWPNKEEMTKDSATVFIFVCAFGAFFVACEMVVAAFLKVIGIGA